MNQKILFITSETESGNNNAQRLKSYLIENNYHLSECDFIHHHIQESLLGLTPDLVIFHCTTASTQLLDSIRLIQKNTPKPLIIFTDHSSDNMIADSIIAGASAFIVDGIESHRIRPIIEAAIARFNKCQTMRHQLEQTTLRLDERRTIDRAKGILMKNKQMSEEEAYQFLRKKAMDKNQRIGQIAQMIIEMAEMFQ